MLFEKSPLFCKLLSVAFLSTALSSIASAEEKSMWQKFKDFFSPVPTVVGEGPEYDELRDLDQQINKLEGKYSRERRANNKKNIRKQIDELKLKRKNLAEKIEAKEKAEKEKQKTVKSSAAVVQPNSASTVCKSDTVTIHDTLFVHDTVTVHDTLYVIVANKATTETAPTAMDSSKTEQPGSTVQDNK
ncbi:MAG: hypothetical protein MJY99_02305 [Fibrobacter sp.]|nr:hypothetical protein [Fibrobacter sp.]